MIEENKDIKQEVDEKFNQAMNSLDYFKEKFRESSKIDFK